MRDRGFLDFLAADCSCVLISYAPCHKCEGPIDPCHNKNNGISSKGPDNEAAPLCRLAHDQYDGRRPLPDGASKFLEGTPHQKFEQYYGVSMQREAAIHWRLYEIAKQGGLAS